MRRDNWRSALIDYIDRQAREPFAYGINDCLIVTAGAIEAMTGVDHAAEYRGCYSSLAEGKRLVGKSLLAFVRGRLPEIHPAEARDGDAGAIRQGREWGFGVFIGPHLYIQTETGMGILPRSHALKAFRVE